ncbi:hypothetical protein I3842_04G062400 [Carya illinoinensis]|uniref:Uncharacterized protein n=1 Tax=Carya illinoinensis TaxID=32201 RepID=A0A922JQJ3_CARIL|nr:hypothetical protein I3842_04G062400 [Carya illinoinensis]
MHNILHQTLWLRPFDILHQSLPPANLPPLTSPTLGSPTQIPDPPVPSVGFFFFFHGNLLSSGSLPIFSPFISVRQSSVHPRPLTISKRSFVSTNLSHVARSFDKHPSHPSCSPLSNTINCENKSKMMLSLPPNEHVIKDILTCFICHLCIKAGQ